MTKKNGYISIENALAMLHPVGSCLILSDATDPNTLFDGTVWELIGQDKCIVGAGNKFTAMQDIPAGLPDHTHQSPYGLNDSGYYHAQGGNAPHPAGSRIYTNIQGYGYDNTYASKYNPIYGASDTVQPPSIALFIWRRTA